MGDQAHKQQRSANMRAIRSKDMKPEMAVRQLVHAMGYRYRLHRHDLPGRPDLVFSARQKIIQVNGCFWHQHSAADCKLSHRPKTNTEYWAPKLERNSIRDAKNEKLLRQIGWDVLVIWECEVKDLDQLRRVLTQFLEP